MNFSYIHGEPDAFYPGSVRARGNRLDRDRLRPDKILAKSKEKEIGQGNTDLGSDRGCAFGRGTLNSPP